MIYSIRLCDLIVIAWTSFFIVKESHALPQDTQPRIFPRADLPNSPPAYDPDKDNYKRYVSKRCSTDQLASEARGWAEAGVLANALNAWKPKSDYQNAMDTYMGTDSSSNWGIFWSYRQRVQNAVTNDKKIHTGQQPSRTYIYVYCDEDDLTDKLCTGNTGAYTWEDLGYIWSNHYLVLCPNNFFDATKTPTMSSQLRTIRDNPSKATDMYSLYWNLGSIYFHETFHWGATVTNPRAGDSDPDDNTKAIYGPQGVKDEATTKNTYANSVIADAYTMVGTAMMLMQTFKLADAPQPLSASIATTWTLPSLGGPPSGWVAAQNSSDPSSQPDMNVWQDSIDAQIDMDDYAPIASSTPAAPPPPPPPPPYATGTCSFHLTETQDCNADYGKNLYGSVVMKDNDKNIIGQTDNDNDHPNGYAMDDGSSYSFTSKLPHPLVITGEHENDYVQFTYGGLSWQSKTPNGGGSCTVGGWDPRDGPVCNDLFAPDQNAVNNMDCSFPC